ncbi:hypothetical protein LTR33_003326 [Friedmanniomyces endolithicus]|nr:hypothetical protein LTR33_003326 [Friedmanniomyces endolithicus]
MRAFTSTPILVLLSYLSLSTAAPAAAECSGISCLEALFASAAALVASKTHPPSPVTTMNPNDCSLAINKAQCAEAGNESPSRGPVCSRWQDCSAFCHTALGSTPRGISITCESAQVVNGHPYGLGTCINLTAGEARDIGNAIIAIGETACIVVDETACIVVDEALKITPKLLSLMGTLTRQTELKWAGKLLQIGTNVFAHGSKLGHCDNAGCPGHNSVAVDPAHLEKSLRLLNVC